MATLTPRVPADDVDAAPPQRRRRVTPPGTVLLVAAGGVFTAFLDATIVNTIFPEIEETFRGSSIGALSWVFNAYSIVTAALLIPAGRLADALGRRRVFRIGTVVFTLGSILCAVAPSLEVLVGARVVQAIGGAALIPTSLALVLDAFPGTTRAHGIAMWSAAAAIAAGVGPAVGGVLVELSGWRLAFLVNLPIGVLIYVATGRTIVESRAPGRRIIPDLAGSLILATSIGALVLAITKVNDWGLGSAPLIATAIAALGLLALFVQRTGRHRAPLFDLELFRIPAFSCANLLMVLAAIAYYAYLLCNVLFLTSVWGYSVLEAGLALTPGPFVAAAISRRFAVVTQRHGFTASLVIGASIWGLGVLWMITRVGTEPAFVAEWLPGMVILGVGAGATFPALSGVAIAAAPDASFATSTALNSVARQLGAALGIALLVAIVGTPGPADLAGAFDRGWALAAAMFALVVAGASTVRRVRQLPDAPAEALRAPFVSALAPLTVTAGAGAVGRLSAFFTEATAPRTETVADVLGRAEWFEELPRRAITELAGLATSRVVAPGDPVHVAGDAARHVLVIRSGRVQVATGDGSPMELGRGAVLGMVTALSRTLHADTVVALRETELIVLDREDLFRVSREVPVAGPRLLTMVSRRLAEAQRAPARTASPATVALVPIDLSVDVRAFAARLSDACGRLGSVGLLDGSEREVGPGQRVADVFGPVLARSERDVDRTLLVAGPDPHTPWTAFCLQHADRVLAVATPRTTAIAEPAQLIGCDLVLLGEGTSEPSLREALLPRATHRIGSDPGDLDRLARRLAGRSLGVVLSGGGRGRSPTWASCPSSPPPASKSIASAAAAWAPTSGPCWRPGSRRRRSTPSATTTGSAATPSATGRCRAPRSSAARSWSGCSPPRSARSRGSRTCHGRSTASPSTSARRSSSCIGTATCGAPSARACACPSSRPRA
ncbi:MAG TPA: MFS transporter [Baekduia sp.]|nr:MFS transporter [Baekduia sp.]